MGTLKDEAKVSGPKTVADLDILDLSLEVQDGAGTDSLGKPYSYQFVEVGNKEYRVPPSVLTQIKTILEKNPNCAKVQVMKEGEGLRSRYSVKEL